jgi:hypothetical protein
MAMTCRRILCASLFLLSGCSLRDLSYLECTPPGCSDGGMRDSGPPANYEAEVKRDSPLVYLRFDERQGPVAEDQLGRANGTYPPSGVTYGAPGALAGDPDTAITLDGTSSITMPTGLDFAGSTPFSVELWARQTRQVDYGFTLDHENYDPARNGWSLLLATDQVGFERWQAGSTNGAVANSTSPLGLGSYHHVVVTFDGTELTLYIDDRVASLNAVTSPLPPESNTWAIGRMNCQCSGNAFVGSIDELAIYGAALPRDRISTHYHAAGR